METVRRRERSVGETVLAISMLKGVAEWVAEAPAGTMPKEVVS